MSNPAIAPRHTGFAMIEVLVTLVILLIGLLGLAGLQSRATTLETESYQRVQGLVMIRDIADRINANRTNAASYSAGPLGQGAPVCTASATLADRDLCEWDAALKGAAETSGGNVGAMLGARGCVTDLNPAAVAPTPRQFLIEVAWQGLAQTATPPGSLSCGSAGTPHPYGGEAYRRVVSTVVSIGTLSP